MDEMLRPGCRVLLASDVGPAGEVVAQMLASTGLTPVMASSGDEAMRLASEYPADLYVVDDPVAGESGAAVVALLRKSCVPRIREAPMIGLFLSDPSWRAFLAAGVSCCVRKPVREAELAKAVRWAMSVYGGS